jgi:hypothetical protein
MKLTINYNGFHGYTSATILVNGKPGEVVELSDSQTRKLAGAACGYSGCQCGENMLKTCEDWMQSENPRSLRIPEDGNEIGVNGNYPQR